MKTQNTATYTPRRVLSEATNPPDTLILDFWLLEPTEKNVLWVATASVVLCQSSPSSPAQRCEGVCTAPQVGPGPQKTSQQWLHLATAPLGEILSPLIGRSRTRASRTCLICAQGPVLCHFHWRSSPSKQTLSGSASH